MDIFLGKHNCKIQTKVTTKVKDAILAYCAAREINESQYLRLALQNQIKSDKESIMDFLDSKNTDKTTQP